MFDRNRTVTPALSLAHLRSVFEQSVGPVIKLIEVLSASDPAKLAQFRREFESLAGEYFENNLVHQDYLLTRATKG